MIDSVSTQIICNKIWRLGNIMDSQDNKIDGLVKGFRELITGTDISCVLFGASMINTSLEGLLKKYLINGQTSNRLLKSDTGLIGSLRAKADLAYVLGLIQKEIYNNILRVLEIRNKFGHNHVKISFSDQNIKSQCEKFNFVNELNNKILHDVSVRLGISPTTTNEHLMIFRSIVYEIVITVLKKEKNIEKSVFI